jgi:RNA polymerase primary sigma factor
MDLSKFPVLTREQEIYYFSLLNQARLDKDSKEEKRITDIIICSNLRFCTKSAIKAAKGDKELQEDLFSAAVIGLMYAIKKFDISKGFRFITYASYNIGTHIFREKIGNHNLIYIPYRLTVLNYQIHRMKEFFKENETSLSDEELAEYFDVPITTIQKISRVNQLHTVNSLNVTLNNAEGEGDEWINHIEDENTLTPEQNLDISIHNDMINKILKSKLKEKDYKIIVLRFGLNGFAPHSYVQIAKKVGISHETARVRLTKALAKLKLDKDMMELRR